MTDSQSDADTPERKKITIIWMPPRKGQEEVEVDAYEIKDGFLVLNVSKGHKRYINLVIIEEFRVDPAG